MLRNKNNTKPPEAMTWGKASPVLILGGVFYFLELLFEGFWFFGPALAGIACTLVANNAIGTTVAHAGGKVVAAGCGTAAGVVGFFGFGAIEAFGIIMAMAVGFLGWMTIGLVILMTNKRIFKENAGNMLWFISGFAISEIPIIGAAPGLFGALLKMYSAQIKTEKAALRAYEKAHANEALQERNQQVAELTRARNLQVAQMQQIEEVSVAANDEQYEEQEEQDEEIPDEVRDAA